MEKKEEQLLIIQAVQTCIARKRQKLNRRKRIIAKLIEEQKTGLHQFRRTIHKNEVEIQQLEEIKTKLEIEFDGNS
jgi:hypothetical protein